RCVTRGATFRCVRRMLIATRPDRRVPSLVCPSLSAPGHASAAVGPALLLLTSGTAGHADLRESCRYGHAEEAHAGVLRSSTLLASPRIRTKRREAVQETSDGGSRRSFRRSRD